MKKESEIAQISDILSEIIESSGIEASKFVSNNVVTIKSRKYSIEHFEVKNKADANSLNRPIGDYYLMSITDIREVSKSTLVHYSRTIADILKIMMASLSANDEVLVVGLGNRDIQSDSLGSRVADQVIVSRLLEDRKSGWPSVSAIAPSVMGETGIETRDIIDAVASKIGAKYIIVIDSLCASSAKRLGTSIQITNAGIVPGGGIQQPKEGITRESVGCEVISIGVPLMIYAKTFCDKSSQIDDNLVVTFHDIEFVVSELARTIAKGINLALFGIDNL